MDIHEYIYTWIYILYMDIHGYIYMDIYVYMDLQNGFLKARFESVS